MMKNYHFDDLRNQLLDFSKELMKCSNDVDEVTIAQNGKAIPVLLFEVYFNDLIRVYITLDGDTFDFTYEDDEDYETAYDINTKECDGSYGSFNIEFYESFNKPTSMGVWFTDDVFFMININDGVVQKGFYEIKVSGAELQLVEDVEISVKEAFKLYADKHEQD